MPMPTRTLSTQASPKRHEARRTRRSLWRDGVSAIALAAGLALSGAAWAGGGNGFNTSGVGSLGGVDGSLSSATGQDLANSTTGGGGGGGVDLTTGNGAPGGAGGVLGSVGDPNGAAGTTGAAGLIVTTPTTISTTITGGTGGAGTAEVFGVNREGGGGGGGVGVTATSDVTVTGTGVVTGGTAGSGSGQGGAGVGIFSSANVTVDAGGVVRGGAPIAAATSNAGAGGGAAAIVLTNGGAVLNAGILTGSTGGRSSQASSGDGGAGVQLLSGGTVINTGVITGGSGGLALRSLPANNPPIGPGHGGAGIEGANLTVVNGGTITGGLGGTTGGHAGPQAAAIQFTGGVNSLEIDPGSVISGNVVAFSTADTLALGGSGNASFDVSTIGSAAQYQGFGIFQKTGSSTWTLTGTTATVTPWMLAGGTLQISSNSNLGDPSGGLTFNGGTLETTATLTSARGITLAGNGTLLTDPGATLTLTSALSGAGGLTTTGAGTLVLTGSNGYAGGTTIAGGTLQLGNGGTSGSIAGDVADNATLAFDRSDAVSFAGAISGSGVVSQIGSGTTTLAGVNTYTGGTSISAGTLIGTATSFGSGAITDNAALVINQPTSASFANELDGAGAFTKQGAGALNYTGTGNLTGPTTVAAGLLAVNGSLANSPVTVQSGATLGGNGTVGATTIQAGGAIAPGNSIGTLHINGAFTQAAGSTYQVQASANASDLILVTGSATLANGALLNVTQDPPGSFQVGTQYTVLTATGGLSGTYTLSDPTVSAFLSLQNFSDANDVYLRVVQTQDLSSAAQTPNQIATANGLDSLGSGNPLVTALLNSPTEAAARSGFNQLSGEAQASTSGMLVATSVLVRDTTIDRLRDVFCTAAPLPGPGTGGTVPVPGCATSADRFSIWGKGFGDWGHADGHAGAAAIDESTGGFLMGVDVPVADSWRVGVFSGYSHTDFNVDARNSSGDTDSYHLGTYGGAQWGALGLRLGASYTWNDLTTNRSVTLPGLSNALRANYSAGTAQVFGELGYRIPAGPVTLEPFANLAYVNLQTDGFTETGGAAALHGQGNTMENTFTTLGVRPSAVVTFGQTSTLLRGMVGWRHAFGTVTPTSVVSFAGGSAFAVQGTPIAQDAAVIELGADVALSRQASLGITYGGQYGGGTIDQSIQGNFAVKF